MLNKGDIIELDGDNDKYIVIKSIEEYGKYFVILAKEEEPTILKFCFLDQDKIKEINDPKVIEHLSSL